MSGMFLGSSFAALDLSKFNTMNVTNMGSMFIDCYNLVSLNISSFDTSNVTDMGTMFSHCTSLKSLDITSFNTTKVTRMDYMFAKCSSLLMLDLSNFNTVNVKDMDCMFSGCEKIETICASDLWNIENLRDGWNMFGGCMSIVGGQGTVYNESNVSSRFAHIDGGKDNPGYFTFKSFSGIERVISADKGVNDAYYSVSGKRLIIPQRGINIDGLSAQDLIAVHACV